MYGMVLGKRGFGEEALKGGVKPVGRFHWVQPFNHYHTSTKASAWRLECMTEGTQQSEANLPTHRLSKRGGERGKKRKGGHLDKRKKRQRVSGVWYQKRIQPIQGEMGKLKKT